MRPRAAAIGLAVTVAHAAAFAAVIARCSGTELVVRVGGPPAAPTLALDAALPPSLAGRITVDDSSGPGLHRRRWAMRYRGGVERAVGAVQLVGPFQDPSAARCSGRIVVGQALLDDGRASPGTIAAAMRRELLAALRGETVFPVGELHRIDQLALRWAELGRHPDDRAWIGDAPHGYIRGTARVVFDRVTVPLTVALVPAPPKRPGGELGFRVAARAELSFENRALQWLSDRLGADRLASWLALRQIDDAIVTALAPPPPFPLPGGQSLRFVYCNEPPEIAENSHGAVPFGVVFGRAADPRILPPQLGRGPRPAPPPDRKLAVEVDLDALNAVLYELWRDGVLDRQLADAGLDRRFNTDPDVQALLSLRLGPPRLTLPPVVTAAPDGLRLSAEAAIDLRDSGVVIRGRLWGGLDFRFAAAAPRSVASGPGVTAATVDVGALELSCVSSDTGSARTPAGDPIVSLVPCYSDLVAALRGRAGELHGALTAKFVQLISDIFVGRLSTSGVTSELAIRGAVPHLLTSPIGATLELALDAAILVR